MGTRDVQGSPAPGKELIPMKFSEMTYTRPDIDALLATCKALAAKAAAARTAYTPLSSTPTAVCSMPTKPWTAWAR